MKHIDIPKPCSQNWHEMVPNASRHYCSSCTKTVVDFSMMTTDGIVAYLSLNKHVCGRFGDQQIELINQQLNQPAQYVLSGWKKWSLAFGFLTTIGYFKASAQTTAQSVQTENIRLKDSRLPENKALAADSIVAVTGVISDDSKLPLPGAVIRVEGTTVATSSDKLGRFKIVLPKNAERISITSVGYLQKVITLTVGITEIGTVYLTTSPGLLGEVVINTDLRSLTGAPKGFKEQ